MIELVLDQTLTRSKNIEANCVREFEAHLAAISNAHSYHAERVVRALENLIEAKMVRFKLEMMVEEEEGL